MSKNEILQTLQQTPPMQIASLDFVREKFVENYNKCNASDSGELMYHRQLVHFNQQIASNEALKKTDPFSLYACFVTAAVNGYSLDPEDSEVYLLPIKGKAHLWRQAGAHVRRLIRTNQIQSADQAKIVYQGDVFQVENGKVIKHVETFSSETMIAAYVKFTMSEGRDKYFIYRKSDWEAWRKKSTMANGENWNDNGQPNASFLRTKVIKHAAKEKCWATGSIPAEVETFTNVEIDADPDEIPTEEQKIPAADHYSEFEEVAEQYEEVHETQGDPDAF